MFNFINNMEGYTHDIQHLTLAINHFIVEQGNKIT